jgi:hypothetical protein
LTVWIVGGVQCSATVAARVTVALLAALALSASRLEVADALTLADSLGSCGNERDRVESAEHVLISRVH